MKRLLSAIFAIITSVAVFAANPDFTYPQTTLDRALKNFKTAVKNPDSHEIPLVKSLLEITGATAAIDPDSVPSVLTYVDHALDATKANQTHALLLTLKADILSSIYSTNRWTYNRRETPDYPYPADITEWNSRQFSRQIDSLSVLAFNLGADGKKSLSAYSDIITADRLTQRYFPTIGAFIASKAYSATSSLFDGSSASKIKDSYINICIPQSDQWFYWKSLQANRDQLAQLYKENIGCEEAGYVLAQLSNYYYNYDSSADSLIQHLKTFIAKYPDFWDINSLRSALSRLTLTKIFADCKNIVLPRKEFHINISYQFTAHCQLNLYKVDEATVRRNTLKLTSAAPIKSIPLSFNPEIVDGDTIIPLTVDRPGFYAIAIKLDSASFTNPKYFLATDVLSSFIRNDNRSALLAVDYLTGRPIKNAKFTETINKVSRNCGSSNSDGILEFATPENPNPKKRTDLSYSIDYKGNCYTVYNGSLYNNASASDAINYQAQIFTDRALYHPGDTIRWAAVIANQDYAYNSHIIEGLEVSAVLRNANNEPIDTVFATTDTHGRISGCFPTSDNGLTGSYRIVVSSKSTYIGESSVTVSDFKIPTFKIDSLSVSRDAPQPGMVTIRGAAMTFAGMPVADAKVEAKIYSAYWSRWFNPVNILSSVADSTDSQGRFEIIIPDSVTSQSKFFLADISVTSSAGETQSASKSFTTGKPLHLSADMPEIINTDRPVALEICSVNADGNKVDTDVRWWICADKSDKTLLSGSCISNHATQIDLSTLSAGRYSISAAPVDTLMADTVLNLAHFTLYSVIKNDVPSSEVIFLPNGNSVSIDGNSAEICVGTPCDSLYLYQDLASGSKLISLKLKPINKGFSNIPIVLPDSIKDAKFKLIAATNGKFFIKTITVNRFTNHKISIEGSSIRDRLTPGAPESWNIHLLDQDGKPISGAAVATMFNSALNSIAPYSMPQSFIFNQFYTPDNLNLGWVGKNLLNASTLGKIRSFKVRQLSLPSFDPEISFSNFRTYNLSYKMASARASGNGAVEEVLVTEDSAEMDMSVAYAAKAVQEDSGYMQANQLQQEQIPFSYRESEVLQAFWLPDIIFDKNGDATLSFTLPDANTTWSLNAFAWNRDLRSTTLIRDIVSAKPVMVQPNLPRFLRAGDSADVLATVFNNSDSTATVNSVIEIFDTATGDVISTSSSSDVIAAGASAIVATKVNAPADASAIGYRVRSTLSSGRFTDGEQAFIPVVAASSDVIESINFYLAPGNADYQTTLPKGHELQSTLDFTANPAWNIIRLLPGLSDRQASTSTGIARQLFASATARGMLHRYPVLADVLKIWNENPDVSALTSRLSQNDNLKAAVLSETPWVQAAASDNQRMARLALIFDRKATKRNIEASISAIAKLQQPDGGWAWGSWSNQSSLWATNSILQQLGRLNAIGYLPVDSRLSEMVSKAMAFYQSKFTKDQKTDQSFAFIVSMFPNVKLGLRATQIVNATHQQFIGSWKSESVWNKAIIATILYRAGYKAVASEILSSIRQFAVTSANRGTSFPSVDNINDYADILSAFALIDPNASEIDGMRQWLTIREQATADLGSIDPTRLIAAYTACGSDWLSTDGSSVLISAGPQYLTPDTVQYATGNFVMSLPSTTAGQPLTISRENASVPAYGSVLSRYSRASSEVKAASCADLSIEKRFMVFREGKWQYSSDFHVGDRVRVLMTIKAKRDLDYVTIIDERPAAFEPVDQLPGWVWSESTAFYRENRDTETRLFINSMPKGTYQLAVEFTVNLAGSFISGIATVQSQLAPSITAHSAGTTLTIK